MDQQCGIATIVKNHIGLAVGPVNDLFCTPPVFFERLTFPGINRDASGRHCGSGVILGREYITGAPANLSAQFNQCFHQYGGLDGHVQRAGNASAFERFFLPVFCAQRHQAGHFGFGDGDFFATPVGQRNIGDFVIVKGRFGNSVHTSFLHLKLKKNERR